MNIAKFAFFAAVLFFSFIFLFSCSMDDNNPWLDGASSSSYSAPAGGMGVCAGVEYDQDLFRCDYGELVGKCSGKDYFPATQKCENGQIKEGSSLSSSSAQGNPPATCGGKSYDPSVFRCEEGELIGKCRGADYYYDYEYCDNGEVKPKNFSSSGASNSSSSKAEESNSSGSVSSSNSNNRMCGGASYDPDVFRCENGELVGRCKGVDYYPAYEVCLNGNVETKADCKGISFVPETEFCSAQDSLVYSRCEGKTYNTNLQGCCGENIYTLSASYKCGNNILLTKCGNDFYDPKTEFCSGNAVYAKCSDSTFNVATHGCKDGEITPKCGDGFYDAAKQFCSAQDTLVYDRCNNAVFNTSTHGCCDNRTFVLETHGCVENLITPKCGNSFYDSATEFCSAQDNAIYDKCDGGAFNTEMQGCCSNKVYDFAAHNCVNGILASKISEGSFTDSRDGKTYKTVKIDSQTWMAENLNYNADGSKCYQDDNANCNKYGRLYSWTAANAACPSGWHLPSNNEWTVLTDYVGGASIAGKQLKASGKNEYKFSALMGGAQYGSSNFSSAESQAYWWTSTPNGSNGIYYNRNMLSTSDNLGTTSTIGNAWGFSVRCLKN